MKKIEDKCKECWCSTCESETCIWAGCEKHEPNEQCYTDDCDSRENYEAEIAERYLDGYED